MLIRRNRCDGKQFIIDARGILIVTKRWVFATRCFAHVYR